MWIVIKVFYALIFGFLAKKSNKSTSVHFQHDENYSSEPKIGLQLHQLSATFAVHKMKLAALNFRYLKHCSEFHVLVGKTPEVCSHSIISVK